MSLLSGIVVKGKREAMLTLVGVQVLQLCWHRDVQLGNAEPVLFVRELRPGLFDLG
jgi:hypothetical protein